MGHVPHLLVSGSWTNPVLDVGPEQHHHLNKVLRLQAGSEVSYSDGLGTAGWGTLVPGGIERGDERQVERPTLLTVAVSPPRSRQRVRFLVEKLSELGVERLAWIRTAHTEGKPPAREKAISWAVAGMEQSRGAWLMDVDSAEFNDLDRERAVVADISGSSTPETEAPILIVGPEGGLTEDEIQRFDHRVSLGPTVLRVETAAIAGAILLSSHRRRRHVPGS